MESEDAAKLLVLQPEEATGSRRPCGCIKTSEKLRKILKSFPSPPPPPTSPIPAGYGCKPYICAHASRPNRPIFYQTNKAIPSEGAPIDSYAMDVKMNGPCEVHGADDRRNHDNQHLQARASRALSDVGGLLADLLVMVQLAVSATALLLYYIIYCYMQLVYFTLRSALYFHEADRPMKITIAVTVLSAFILTINLFWRLERIFGILTGETT